MRVYYLTDACVLLEYKDKKIICDPWLTESICYGGLYHYPPIQLKIENYIDVDAIYISHIHEDHLDSMTLNFYDKKIPILIHCYEEKHVLNKLRSIGFENIIEISHKESYFIDADFSIEILAADNCDPLICNKFFGCQVSQGYEKSLQIDSMAIFKGGDYAVVNTNDCPYELSSPMNQYIKKKYKKIDYLLTSYNGASPYPQCFENFTHDEKLIEKEKIQLKCLNRLVKYCKDLKPTYVLPFAAQRVIGGEMWHLNQYTAATPFEDVEKAVIQLLVDNNISTEVIMMNSEEFFDLEKKSKSAPFTPPSKEERENYLKEILSKKSYSFEFEDIEENNLLEDIKIAQKRMNKKITDVYHNMKIDTTLYLNTNQGYLYKVPMNGELCEIVKENELEEPFLRITLDYKLLDLILNRKAHWNNAEFASLLKFYRKPNEFERSVHHMISYLHK
ncbi:MBL fold metallo-hydrolase [Rummeliibacillus sp. NPDC094406]|uniref:MBL fold metallo-hydrolase n=1 Tax=Rummeliibacillus sp. NPDC094406 TaxID=3364511 RepID=UPI00382D2E9D